MGFGSRKLRTCRQNGDEILRQAYKAHKAVTFVAEFSLRLVAAQL